MLMVGVDSDFIAIRYQLGHIPKKVLMLKRDFLRQRHLQRISESGPVFLNSPFKIVQP